MPTDKIYADNLFVRLLLHFSPEVFKLFSVVPKRDCNKGKGIMRKLLVSADKLVGVLVNLSDHLERHEMLRRTGFDVFYCGPLRLPLGTLSDAQIRKCLCFAVVYHGTLVNYFWEDSATHTVIRYACTSPFCEVETNALIRPERTQQAWRFRRQEGETIRYCIAQARTLALVTGTSVITAFETAIVDKDTITGIEYAIRVPSGIEREGRYVVVFVSGAIREVTVIA